MRSNSFHRPLRVCYFNLDAKTIDSKRIALEKKLNLLGSVSIYNIKGMTDPNINPCDLLVLAAQRIPHDEFNNWLGEFSKKIEKQGHIWIPTMIFSDVPFHILRETLEKAVQMNWYFDIIRDDHLDSIPIRVANLLRIHDHLHELDRYENTLNSLSAKLDHVKKELYQLKDSKSGNL